MRKRILMAIADMIFALVFLPLIFLGIAVSRLWMCMVPVIAWFKARHD